MPFLGGYGDRAAQRPDDSWQISAKAGDSRRSGLAERRRTAGCRHLTVHFWKPSARHFGDRGVAMQLTTTTQAILKAKAAKGLSWANLAEQLQATDVWLASCVYGENSMLPPMASQLCALLDLDEEAHHFLT